MDNFEKAVKDKYRFNWLGGSLTMEDLYDLPLVSVLDDKRSLEKMAAAIDSEIKSKEFSFVSGARAVNDRLQTSFEIVISIIKSKLDLEKAAKNALDRKKKKEEIMEAISEKKSKNLKKVKISDLEKMLNDL